MIVLNKVMKFQNVDIFYKMCYFFTCRLHSPAAWKALSCNLPFMKHRLSCVIILSDFILAISLQILAAINLHINDLDFKHDWRFLNGLLHMDLPH